MPLSTLAQEAGRGDPKPLEVRMFGGPDFSGAMRSLTLDVGQSYAYFERLDDEEISSARSLKAGASVGVVLFRNAFFVSRDQNCAPTLGSDEKPGLVWTGATADFLPDAPGKPGVDKARDVSDASGKGYASAILFLRAEGPPPGALLMKRRRSYGKGCGNILRSLNFDRRFVPLDFQTSLSEGAESEPRSQGCVNLRGAKAEGPEGTDAVRLRDMLKSDRIALLQPSDLDPGYGKQDRRFQAVLYDGDNCQGASVTLDTPTAPKSGGAFADSRSGRRDILLSDFLFRERVRSLRVQAPGSRAKVVAKAPSPAPTPDGKTVVAAKPAEAPKKPILSEPKAVPIETKAAPQTKDAGARTTTGLATAKLAPVTELPVQPKAPVVAAATVAQPLQTSQASQAVTPPPRKVISPDVRFAEEDAVLADKKAGPSERPKPEGARVETAQAETAPQSDTPAAADPAAAGEQVFTFPVYDVYRLNYCLSTKGGCGEAAALKWCELKGFKRAVAWQKDNNIGGIFPTFLIGDRRICAQYKCDGFSEITCGN